MARSEDQDIGVCRTPTILLINPNELHDLQKREEMKRIFFLVASRVALQRSPSLHSPSCC